MSTFKKLILLGSFCGVCSTPLCGEASVPQWLQDSTVKGFVSMYDWTSINHYFSPYDQYTMSVGGGLFLGTPRYKGFSLAIEPMGQSGLGTHASNPNLVSPTLGPSFSTLGQAYVQYKKYGINAKVGDVELNDTPWDGSDVGYRILPITYQGVSFDYTIGHGLKFYFARMYKWRYFNQESYNRETAYSIYLPDDQKKSDGLLNVGLKYKGFVPGINFVKTNSELWFYNYYQYNRLYMLQSVNTIGKGPYKGIVGYQFMHAGKSSGFLGNVNSQLYGAELGAKSSFGKVVLAYDYLPAHPNSFNYGGLATPYDTITDSGPIFAQPVMTSTQDLGSGTAAGIKVDYYGIKNLFTQVRFTHLHMRTTPIFENYNEYNLILSYSFSGVKGLNLTDIASYANEHPSSNPNFYQNRLMLVYNF
ncbi:hypothetical protein H7F10_05050 [Acidithiobacillus sp. HP-6]|uniref:hypothetical protein n=1 Tax=unclassified Acidithiobacillus TaxID=2614800 RepID=UPI0018790777|nr:MULTISPECIES: hypothetical protein [unclassified Acidithiobacillus]MBE7562330.1 hypothetical protein [Acidithiobacillus sp. HP-6]MBE7570876.1 hypothetical protein [Acidithiobacillus sp. HP-2]